MKKLVAYFSLTGNTKLSMQYLSNKITDVEIDLYDIKNDETPNLEEYDFYGFASFADHMGPPKYMRDYVSKMPNMSGKYAFVVNTFGGMSGPTLSTTQRHSACISSISSLSVGTTRLTISRCVPQSAMVLIVSSTGASSPPQTSR